jgi:exodeoxyribonuclease-3
MFKIATWNVNSLRVRLPQVLDWLKKLEPDIVALQETKMTDNQFPLEAIQAAGYHVRFSGQKTYNGVALLSRLEGSEIITDLPDLDDPQRRFLGATYANNLRVLNVYVPNGAAVNSDKYHYKLNWLKKLQDYVRDSLKDYPHLIVLGDFNIAPEDRDVYDAWDSDLIVSPPERAALEDLLSLGLHDTFRLFEQAPESFSWWDYRRSAFWRNQGIRIDLILASTALDCTACVIDLAPRRLKRPSDHAPVVASFEFD